MPQPPFPYVCNGNRLSVRVDRVCCRALSVPSISSPSHMAPNLWFLCRTLCRGRISLPSRRQFASVCIGLPVRRSALRYIKISFIGGCLCIILLAMCYGSLVLATFRCSKFHDVGGGLGICWNSAPAWRALALPGPGCNPENNKLRRCAVLGVHASRSCSRVAVQTMPRTLSLYSFAMVGAFVNAPCGR